MLKIASFVLAVIGCMGVSFSGATITASDNYMKSCDACNSVSRGTPIEDAMTVPEPGMSFLLGSGLVVLGTLRRHRIMISAARNCGRPRALAKPAKASGCCVRLRSVLSEQR